jgi:hypothetical protein
MSAARVPRTAFLFGLYRKPPKIGPPAQIEAARSSITSEQKAKSNGGSDYLYLAAI